MAYEELGRCWKGRYSFTPQGTVQVDIDTVLRIIPIPVRLTIDVVIDDPWNPNEFDYTTRGLPIPIMRKNLLQ